MLKIYQGVWATVITLGAEDGYSGIARTRYRASSRPVAAGTSTTQLVCTREGQQLFRGTNLGTQNFLFRASLTCHYSP
jgi:hypothetical protein